MNPRVWFASRAQGFVWIGEMRFAREIVRSLLFLGTDGKGREGRVASFFEYGCGDLIGCLCPRMSRIWASDFGLALAIADEMIGMDAMK